MPTLLKSPFHRGSWLVAASCLLITGPATCEDQPVWTGPIPKVWPLPEPIGSAFQNPITILRPDKNEAEWWAGAPSVVRDDAGIFWLAARMRSPDHPVGLRGYEIRLFRLPRHP